MRIEGSFECVPKPVWRRRQIEPYAGFTLLEVLIVVAIIALLAAMLIPALARAREQARSAVCQNNLHQVATALNTYAVSGDHLVPGDAAMGHDVWGGPAEGPGAGGESRPVNLGHLLETRALPMPRSESHPFYCPTLSIHGAPWSFTYRHSGPYTATAPRGFEGWGKPGRVVNIGYEYRDSIDGAPAPAGLPVLARRLSRAAKRALISDVFSWGTGQWAHRTRYQFAYGDGSVGFFKDSGAPRYLYKHFTNTSTSDDHVAFRVFERSSAKGILWP